MASFTMHSPDSATVQEVDACNFTNLIIRDGDTEANMFFFKRQCARDMAQVFSLHHDTKIAHRADKMLLLSAALIAVDDPSVETLRALELVAADMAYENCCDECGAYADKLHEDPAGKYVCIGCLERITSDAAEAKQAGAEDKADADYRQRCLDDRGTAA
ncbi:hypothetical protein [Paenirhodobacter enshiensis]|uniref:hypothetical protein n=1 Tax=Paenirhodobacter enshiensis TaxID=1105367 RepID=UPI0035AFF35A